MTRKNLFISLGGFKDTYPSNEDLDLWITYLESGQKLAQINSPLLNYRRAVTQGYAYWAAKPELSVMYKVIDEKIIAKRRDLSPGDLKEYSINKSRGYLFAAFNAFMVKDRIKQKMYVFESVKLFRFPLFNSFGLAQRFSSIAFIIKKYKKRISGF
jgi:hypothetical protein